jgi:hypothetical protein
MLRMSEECAHLITSETIDALMSHQVRHIHILMLNIAVLNGRITAMVHNARCADQLSTLLGAYATWDARGTIITAADNRMAEPKDTACRYCRSVGEARGQLDNIGATDIQHGRNQQSRCVLRWQGSLFFNSDRMPSARTSTPIDKTTTRPHARKTWTPRIR